MFPARTCHPHSERSISGGIRQTVAILPRGRIMGNRIGGIGARRLSDMPDRWRDTLVDAILRCDIATGRHQGIQARDRKESAVANVTLGYAEMEQVKATFEKDAADMETSLRNLLKLVNQLTSSNFKTDKASPAFLQSCQNIEKGGLQVMQGIQGLGKFLGAAVQGAQQLDDQLAKALGKA
jgi:Proteins of 100 residues with WXG